MAKQGYTMSALRTVTAAATLCALLNLTNLTPAMAGPSPAADPTVKPGDDFYAYANNDWMKTTAVPAGVASYDNRAVIAAATAIRVNTLIQAAANSPTDALSQKVGDYYAGFLDTAAIDAAGTAALDRDVAAIAALADKTGLAAYLGSTLNIESDGLTGNADHIIGLLINQGFHDGDHNVPHLLQGGLGLAGRDDYLDASPEAAAHRTQYAVHIAAILTLAHLPDAEARAQKVLALETAIAQSHAPDVDAADVFKQDNVWNRGDFAAKAPGMDWIAYFQAAGLGQQDSFTVWQTSAMTGLGQLVAATDLDTWKDYLTFHLIEHYAPVLPKAYRDLHAAFYTPDGAVRHDEAMTATTAAAGEAVGRLYVAQYFPPSAKAAVEAMRDNLFAAYRVRLTNLAWMTPATRTKALAKLSTLVVGVGYPDTWTDYADLKIVRGDAYGNMQRAEAFSRSHNLAKLSQPVNPGDWTITAQQVGAVIMFSPNSEFFAAPLMQPPFFDPDGDTATNYGSAGAAMAHEISHTFDNLGNIYDERGQLGLWWTPQDQAQYDKAAQPLVAQFNQYCPFDGVCVDGRRTLSENFADLTGLQVAHDAYLLALQGQPDTVIDGLSGEQRFFLAFARRWRKIQNDDSLRKQIATDIHTPGLYRSDTVRNMDAWYAAFDIQPGDKLYVKPEDRARTW